MIVQRLTFKNLTLEDFVMDSLVIEQMVKVCVHSEIAMIWQKSVTKTREKKGKAVSAGAIQVSW